MRQRAATSEQAGKTESEAIPVVNEELQVDTEVIETGAGVRVKKTTSEREEFFEEPLFRHEAVVERVVINELVDGPDLPKTRYEGETVIVPVLEEVLVVEKRTILKEEIHIVRRTREAREAYKVALRTEQVSAERFDDPAGDSDRSVARD